MKKQKTRRDFIKSGAIATGAVAATPYFNWSAKAFANQEKNDRPNIGCIGVGSMGSGDARGHANFGSPRGGPTRRACLSHMFIKNHTEDPTPCLRSRAVYHVGVQRST